MQLAGVAAGDLVGLVRDARRAAAASAQLIVTGVLAAELARRIGGDTVRVGGDPSGATALIVVLGGAATDDDDQAMRRAARAHVPIVAVQTDPRVDRTALPYVAAGAVVTCPPGEGFPLERIGAVLARELGSDAVVIAARVATLREPIVHELVRQASLRAAILGGLPWRKGADFPVLALLQARLVLDVAAADGREVGQERAPELAAVAGTGLGLRGIVRRLPTRIPLVGGLTGYLGTRALGEAAVRRFAAG
jgi:uncharacterized protein (DUF697 family)